MTLSRRSFLRGGLASGSVAAIAGKSGIARARSLVLEPTLADVVQRALGAATKAGATYADVRVVHRRNEWLSAREARVEGATSNDEYGLGVRVIAGGAWGFAATPIVTAADAERVARAAVELAKANSTAPGAQPVVLAKAPAAVDVYRTPLVKDPFELAFDAKVDLLLAINREAMKVAGVQFVSAYFVGQREWKLFASTEGASIEQEITRIEPGFRITAVDAKLGEFESVSSSAPPRQAGWEYVESLPLIADARRLGELAVQKLAAPSVVAGKHDLVIAPSNLWLVIHESIGHSTELDRALGLEANFAGTSFLTPDQLHKTRVGAPILTFYADKTTQGALATCAYDDDGVATQRWNLIDRGVFVDYQTTRDQAAWIGETASHGTSYADSYASVPFQRMPNVSLAPQATQRSLDDLVAITDDGILIEGTGSWSIDHQRKNFQFGGQVFWELKHGKRTRMLRDVAYQSNTIEFWTACDAIGGPASWEMYGSMSDGKGEPEQLNAVSHGCPPVRIRGANVLDTNRRIA